MDVEGFTSVFQASVYRNEEEVGRAIKDSGIAREDVFLTSKLAPADHGNPRAYDAALESLRRLGVDYFDLFLIHWPGMAGLKPSDPLNKSHRLASWAALERLHTEGLAKAIGVSNYTQGHLEELVASSECTVVPHGEGTQSRFQRYNRCTHMFALQ